MVMQPTLSALNMVESRNLGCVVRPTEEMAQAPSWPTIIRSTMLVSWVSSSSISDGQAMATMSPYSSREVTESGSAGLRGSLWPASDGSPQSSLSSAMLRTPDFLCGIVFSLMNLCCGSSRGPPFLCDALYIIINLEQDSVNK